MGAELIIFTYFIGLVPFAFGRYVVVAGRVYLSVFSKEPIKGEVARWLGSLCLLATAGFYAIITWAWSVYDR